MASGYHNDWFWGINLELAVRSSPVQSSDAKAIMGWSGLTFNHHDDAEQQ